MDKEEGRTLQNQDANGDNLNVNFFDLYSRSKQEILLKRFYSQVTENIETVRSCVAMVVQEVPGRRLEGFGSGFFYEKNGWPFFVTARHVVEDIQKNCLSNRITFLHVRGRKGFIKLPGLEFFCDQETDLAAAALWKRPKETYEHVDFFKEADVSRFNGNFEQHFFAFTGFPASKNKTYTGNQVKAHQRNITMFMRENPDPAITASPFIYFGFDPNHMYDANFEKMATGIPHGMSGGPMFEITNTFESPKLKLAGMGLACLPETNLLKIVRFDLINLWLEHYFD